MVSTRSSLAPRSPLLSAPPSPPQRYEVDPSATLRTRLECLLLNYINKPSLLQEIHIGGFFSACPSENTHHRETLSLSHPVHDPLFMGAGLDTFPDLHHVEVCIKTVIRSPSSELEVEGWEDSWGHSWEILHILDGRCFDAYNNLLFIPGDNKLPTPFMKVFQWGPSQLVQSEDVSVRYRELYTWKCVIEYIKIQCGLYWFGGEVMKDPLKHLGFLGGGEHLRRIEEGGESRGMADVVRFPGVYPSGDAQ